MDAYLVPTAFISLVVGIVGWLLKRAITGNDKAQEELKDTVVAGLKELSGKVDMLATKDSQHSESLVELKVRVATLERELTQLQRATQRRRSTDEDSP